MVVNVPESLIPNVEFVESVKVKFAPFPELEPIDATVKEAIKDKIKYWIELLGSAGQA